MRRVILLDGSLTQMDLGATYLSQKTIQRLSYQLKGLR